MLLGTALNSFAQTTQSPLPPPTGYVNDYVGVINRATKTELETTLTNLDREQKIQFAVAVVDTTGGQDIADYSRDVARGWGLGSKDTNKPSLLLLVAIKDRKYFTQVSRHLEGDLPDGLAGQIQREKLVPAFRESDYSGGIRETIYEYIRTVARKQGFSTDKIFRAGTSRRHALATSRPKASICVSIVVIGRHCVSGSRPHCRSAQRRNGRARRRWQRRLARVVALEHAAQWARRLWFEWLVGRWLWRLQWRRRRWRRGRFRRLRRRRRFRRRRRRRKLVIVYVRNSRRLQQRQRLS